MINLNAKQISSLEGRGGALGPYSKLSPGLGTVSKSVGSG